eukprot:COSAG02_NODE_12290_length_1567_cov_19.632153_1_plen_57_part_00
MRMRIFGALLAAVPGLMVEAEVQVERSAWDALVGSAKDTVGGACWQGNRSSRLGAR